MQIYTENFLSEVHRGGGQSFDYSHLVVLLSNCVHDNWVYQLLTCVHTCSQKDLLSSQADAQLSPRSPCSEERSEQWRPSLTVQIRETRQKGPFNLKTSFQDKSTKEHGRGTCADT